MEKGRQQKEYNQIPLNSCNIFETLCLKNMEYRDIMKKVTNGNNFKNS